MIRNLKAAFGLSVLAALVVGVMGAMSASATTSGHFVSDAPSGGTIIDAVESTSTSHKTTLSAYGATVECHQATYTNHHVGTTWDSMTVTPTYHNCTTGSGGAATVKMNGCHYQFTARTPPAHATVHFICPVGKKAEVETSAGLEKFGAQTPTSGGVVYETITMNNKHAVTANITVEGIHAECHGACQLLGTNTTTAKLTGSVTVSGTDTVSKEPVNVTAT